MNEPTEFPARLHVLLAREAPVGVVIRRGPSKRVCTLLWDRETDEFRVGQWLHGRIYERRSDLSPDGRHMIYFAMNGHWDGEAKGSWTAISRAPYLKALTLLAKGDCWHGGGLFTGDGRYWLNDGYGHEMLRDSREVARDKRPGPAGEFGGECLGVYYPRLLRDGWTLVRREEVGEWRSLTVFEMRLAGGWTLRKIAHEELGAPPGKGCYWDEHALDGPGGLVALPGWEWAEMDGPRLAWAEGGKLFAAGLGVDGLGEPRVLHDFNGMIFEPLEAPY
jgi:hypothetical protein